MTLFHSHVGPAMPSMPRLRPDTISSYIGATNAASVAHQTAHKTLDTDLLSQAKQLSWRLLLLLRACHPVLFVDYPLAILTFFFFISPCLSFTVRLYSVCVYRYVSVHFCRSWITITCLSTAESPKDPWNRARITNSFLRVNLRCVSLSVHNIQVEPKTDCNSYTNCDVERRSERNTFLYVCYQYAGATKLQTFKTVQFLAHLIYLHCTHHVGSTLFFVLVSLQLFAFISTGWYIKIAVIYTGNIRLCEN